MTQKHSRTKVDFESLPAFDAPARPRTHVLEGKFLFRFDEKLSKPMRIKEKGG
jgi:hypothetical protein